MFSRLETRWLGTGLKCPPVVGRERGERGGVKCGRGMKVLYLYHDQIRRASFPMLWISPWESRLGSGFWALGVLRVILTIFVVLRLALGARNDPRAKAGMADREPP